MPMIDVYAPEGAFDDPHELARRLAGAVIVIGASDPTRLAELRQVMPRLLNMGAVAMLASRRGQCGGGPGRR